ncbi:IS1096 element passenger TnpR family protein [Methylocystis sp. JAN1]|uniref:IS1096 element passenger TnpR family protein n=1 Tax=Methylocystis sp. JAN1 TaxID=3397211 RepID=UPI003FA230F0
MRHDRKRHRSLQSHPDDVEPKVRRRVEVPLSIKLDRLHLTLQAALGWLRDDQFAPLKAPALRLWVAVAPTPHS